MNEKVNVHLVTVLEVAMATDQILFYSIQRDTPHRTINYSSMVVPGNGNGILTD